MSYNYIRLQNEGSAYKLLLEAIRKSKTENPDFYDRMASALNAKCTIALILTPEPQKISPIR